MKNTINEALASLKPRDKDPHSVSVLARWIAEAENQMEGGRSGRLSWLVASVVATAKLQQVVDELGKPLFLLKGGSLLQHRLGLASRPTKDLDGLVRAEISEFIGLLDEKMRERWGAVGFSRSEVSEIRVPGKLVNPRQFDMTLSLKGRVWRKITVEVSPDEGMAGSNAESFPPPSLSCFGLPTPDELIGLAISYQAAQKIHAASAPHNPPEYVNNRARDVVDIILIRDLTASTGSPVAPALRAAIEDIFDARAFEAKATGRAPHVLPAVITAYPHWTSDYKTAASSAGISLTLEKAVREANDWISSICK